ncbi:hypothetical protein EDD22DRAFT_853025 [Suillus occidentalis]|nr:hypothetical protein EDD22DRAFT_853025 [Suillus occidentalis]
MQLKISRRTLRVPFQYRNTSVSAGAFRNLLVASEQFFPEGGHSTSRAAAEGSKFRQTDWFFFSMASHEAHFIITAGEPKAAYGNLAEVLVQFPLGVPASSVVLEVSSGQREFLFLVQARRIDHPSQRFRLHHGWYCFLMRKDQSEAYDALYDANLMRMKELCMLTMKVSILSMNEETLIEKRQYNDSLNDIGRASEQRSTHESHQTMVSSILPLGIRAKKPYLCTPARHVHAWHGCPLCHTREFCMSTFGTLCLRDSTYHGQTWGPTNSNLRDALEFGMVVLRLLDAAYRGYTEESTNSNLNITLKITCNFNGLSGRK